MRNMKRYIAVLSCVIIFTSFSYNIYTAPDTSKQDAQIQDSKRNIAEIEERQKVVLAAKQAAEAKIADLSASISELDSQADNVKAEIAIKEAEIAALENEEQENKELFTKRMRALYEDDSHSGIELLLSSKSLGDLFFRMDLISQVAEFDQKVIADIINQKEMVESAKAELAEKVDELEVVIDKLEVEQNEFKAEEKKERDAYNELAADKKAFEAIEEKAKAQREAIIKEAAAKANNSGSAPISLTGGKLNKPASGTYTSMYGPRTHPVTGQKGKMHTGVDIAAPTGTSIVAAEAGTVSVSGYDSGYGNYIVVNHGGGLSTLYAHCSARLVSVGAKVTRGQLIAKMGSTGLSTGSHLHFEVRINNAHTNPLPYIS